MLNKKITLPVYGWVIGVAACAVGVLSAEPIIEFIKALFS